MSKVPKESTTHVEPVLVHVKSLARMLSMSVRTVWRMNSCGKLPRCIRVGRSVRWNVETIRDWLDQGCPDRETFEGRQQGNRGGREKHVA